MLMALGQFVFQLTSAPFREHRRERRWRQAGLGRVGLLPARQYLGPEDEINVFTGVLYPELTGGPVTLAALEAMADAGKPYLLLGGDGEVRGYHVIVEINTTRSEFFADGTARRIEFQLALARVDDADIPH